MSAEYGSDLLFETNRFNLSEVKAHFINPCCFGEDLAAWLRGKLAEKGVEASAPGQEDWGWYLDARYKQAVYFIACGGNADDASADKNQGEWRVGIEKSRTIWEKLTGQNKMSEQDELLGIIRGILTQEPGFKNVRTEA